MILIAESERLSTTLKVLPKSQKFLVVPLLQMEVANMSNLNFEEGTAELVAQIKQSPSATNFDFFDYRTDEGEVSLKIRNKNELKFTHKYKDTLNVLTFIFANYFDKKVNIVVTWSKTAKELKLYIDGNLKTTEKMNWT